MNFTPDKKPYKKLPPFKGWVLENFPFIEADFDALNNYQMMCKVIEYLKVFQGNLDNMDDNVNSLYNAFVELQNYVNNYFDNLDVQEEINNKLDEMVESGELQELIAEYFDVIETIKYPAQFIFPKFIPDSYMGDCNLIKIKDKNILIDTDISNNFATVRTYLNDNDATHIDYLIISHYDSDHIGNVENLINYDYIDSDTEVLLPVVPNRFPEKQAVETQIKTILTNNNISFRTPIENEVLTIEDLSIKFGNLDRLYMEENYSQYNWTSMVCLITHKNITALYMGDGGVGTYKYLDDNNFITTTIDLYKQGHHGIDYQSTLPLIEKISPRYTVQSSGIMDYVKNNFLNPETALLIKQGSLYYPTYMQTDYIKFESTGISLNCINGITFNPSGQFIQQTLYVDINASKSSIQDGTEAHPFSELMQAVASVKNYPNAQITINVADGNYGYSHEAPGTSLKNRILFAPNGNIRFIINGNSNDRTKVKLNNIMCESAYIRLNNLTVDLDTDTGLFMYNSTAYLNNVHITSLSSTQTSHTGVIASEGSRICLENNCKIEYANQGLRVMRSSVATYKNITFDHISQNNVLVDSGFTPMVNIQGTTTDHVDTLTDKFTRYKWINIQFRDSDGHRSSIYLHSPANGTNICVSVPYTNSQGITYEKRAMLTLQNDNQIAISNEYQIIINNGTVTTASVENGISIQQVWAGYDNI